MKNFFQTNKEARDYFISNSDEELFYTKLADISQINFEKKGEPQLDKGQFEILRVSLQVFKHLTEENEEENYIFDYKPKNIKFHIK